MKLDGEYIITTGSEGATLNPTQADDEYRFIDFGYNTAGAWTRYGGDGQDYSPSSNCEIRRLISRLTPEQREAFGLAPATPTYEHYL